MSQFKPGDTVTLKSGGPQMTVENVGDYMDGPGVKCVWFDGKKALDKVFKAETLREVKYDE